ncbi:hypothetical protein [Rubrobacter aplysinae]|uniref:hypothetical protein n=1 Tax=Rubrobacter aplysinae TaxID=909625 RepID=UPI001364B6E8|nr:hypothetical protein [Rubrobacter aplysinae]
MRTPAWMIAYAAVLLFSGVSYAALVFVGQGLALASALAALVAAVIAVVLVVRR